ncbi:MAG: RIP metalloprotease RseP [Pseudomonadota bacterium]|jgi:regulator of sigma E protease|nr:RIP metalloprotease RseP [Arenicellales bacterium]MEC7789835.1 RIP metalloprotease RseP [Pseudomonadota bacterium]MEC8960928.1 RIP metalloprotease RseP [Pseudomonadota bacterium]|tara:strand:- start:2434 stop:3774 length:1341 start_codon:yes stop_codon:yes gene_type:complete
MAVVENVGWFLVAVFILVTFHELGHFSVARLLGVGVSKFSIGFGKTLYSFRSRRSSTEYVLGVLPFGGYVKFIDEREDDVDPRDLPRAFNRQNLWVRTAVVIAGPGANFILAIFFYWLVFGIGVPGVEPVIGYIEPGSSAEVVGLQRGDRIARINGRNVRSWGEHRYYLLNQVEAGETLTFAVVTRAGQNKTVSIESSELQSGRLNPLVLEEQIGILPRLAPIVGTLIAGEVADAAGIKVNDQFMTIDGIAIDGWRDVVKTISSRPDQTIRLSLLRNGALKTIVVVPKAIHSLDSVVGRIGVGPANHVNVVVRLGAGEAITRAVEATWLLSKLTVGMIVQMVQGKESTKNIGGPLSIAKYAGASAEYGFTAFLTFLAILSISLGILNLLPIPVLDGGHLVYFIIEGIKGGPVSEAFMYRSQQLGFAVLAVLISFALYNDVHNIFKF